MEAHAQTGYEEIIDLCGGRFDDDSAFEYLAYFDGGFYDFAIDVLRRRVEFGLLDDDSPAVRREDYPSALRQLCIKVEEFDRAMSVFDSGELLRTVVEFDDGVTHLGRVRPREYLAAITLDRGRADQLDEGASTLVTTIRREVYGLGDEDPGGYADTRVRPLAQPSSPRHTGDLPAALYTEMLRLCSWQLAVGDLHYVALFQNWSPAFAADLFDTAALQKWFRGRQDRRRKQYEDFGRGLRSDLPQLAHALRLFSVRPIRRLVLDVQEGALYYYPLAGEGDFLLGMTYHQPGVYQAELRLRELAGQVRALLSAG
ncbi:hypothetical protein [Microtetraspora sp. NBRC 13810]|uniref:hypothetical protein n=1 Tax=Microtetraspora sp. NBRC 13810 TaxID=3030990 RepID=UPI00255665C0|nr:hypothetical protein [Microtetraspora sp. NBRC 13810]